MRSDAKTGLPIPDFGNEGMVTLRDGVADKGFKRLIFYLTSPAGIYKNLAIISPSTQEFGSKGPSGDPCAFDIRTGNHGMSPHTVPQPREAGSRSWGREGR